MRVCLGVGGGIAAYKAAELVRRLQDSGHEVQVVMTRAACEFITPLTLASLSGRKVITGLFEGPAGEANIDSAIEHIAVAQSIDLLLVAPATADLLAKMAQGHASDFLTTLYLATHAPVVMAPSMNVNMWTHPATQENLKVLRARGVRMVEPGDGYLACGMVGSGRLAEVSSIVEVVSSLLENGKSLEGQTVLVTAGPTQEEIDPVRYITNRSSGRMGYAIAEAAARRGAHVVLVSGPTGIAAPGASPDNTAAPLAASGAIDVVNVRSAAEMAEAVFQHLDAATIVVMAAAVADYTPVVRASHKIKKDGASLHIELQPTRDILAEIGARKGSRFIVGFAAETENLIDNARRKLQRKNIDLIVANDVSGSDTGFDSEFNAATILASDGVVELQRMTKREMASRILDEVAARLALVAR